MMMMMHDLTGAPIKRCRVCGDRAIGFNFNGLSCGSCKSFFRRNSPKHEHFKCRKGNNCQIDIHTRKCCTKCRLDKCVRIGMRRELITFTSEESVQLKRLKQYHSYHPPVLLDSADPMGLESLLDVNIQRSLISIEPEMDDIFGDSSVSNPEFGFTLDLNPYEQRQIQEIEVIVARAFANENSVPLVADATDRIYVLNLSEYYIRRTVKFCKCLPVFRCLTQTEQLDLLKAFFTELMIIRLVFFFEIDKDGYRAIKDNDRKQAIFIKLSVLYSEAKQQNMLRYSRRFATAFCTELEQDTTIRDLLLVESLCRPRADLLLSCPEILRYQYYVTRRLLQRYLEHKYKDSEMAEIKYQRIVALLKEIECVKQIVDTLFVEADDSQLAIVLNEIFKQ